MAARHLYKDVSSWRRGPGRVAFFLSFSLLLLMLAGCGGGGTEAVTDEEKATDVEFLNHALAQELTLVETYERALPPLQGRTLALAQQLRGQSQAHVSALTKSVRGLDGEVDAEPTPPDSAAPADRAAALTLVYEGENAALSVVMEAAPHMETAAPRTLAAALAASHAQHLTVLRQALGADLAASVPEPFESGEALPPGGSEEDATSQ